MTESGLGLLALLCLLCLVASIQAFEPIADRDEVDRLRREVQPVMDLDEERLLELIPTRSGFRFVGCPNCDGGAEEDQITWSIDQPDDVFCQYCKMRFPNESYPETGIHEVANPQGEEQAYPYWEAPHPAPSKLTPSLAQYEPAGGYRHYFRAKGWYVAREYFTATAWKLAQLYYLTGEAEFAQRSALIIQRFAAVYPGYCARYDYPFQQKVIFPGRQTFPYPAPNYLAAKWDYWAYGDIPTELVWAYDLVRDSGALDHAERLRIERDLIRASVTFTMAHTIELSNMDPWTIRGLVSAGRVLGEPAYVHEAVDWIGELIRRRFFVDGMWMEGAVSYHNQTVWGLFEVLQLLEGYSDPPGYRHPDSGRRFDELRLEEELPFFAKTLGVGEMFRYPNGRVVAVHDTWAYTQGDPPSRSVAQLFAGVGHAWLGRGEGSEQLQAHLHFSAAHGHAHGDMLAITLFSHGRERLSDIGYTWTKHRQWATSTLSHSTVLVNGREQARSADPPTDGDLRLFLRDGDDFQLVEASGPRAYPGLVEDYSRLLVMVGTPGGHAYIIDVFRVQGGERHELIYVGDADHAGRVDVDLETKPFGETLLPADVDFVLPSGESVPGSASGGHNFHYAYVTDVASAEVDGAYELNYHSDADPRAVVRIHGLTSPPGQLLVGRAPSVRQAQENEGRLDDHWMPISLYRREGTDLRTTFVHVLEPHGEAPFIDSVERLPSEGDGVALKIVGNGWTDHILVSDETRVLDVGDLALQGLVGYVREGSGRIEKMKIVGGTRFAKGETEIRGDGIIGGALRKTLRKASGDPVDGLLIDTPLSLGADLDGLTAVVHTADGFALGCEVEAFRLIAGEPVLVLKDDPGFEIDAANSRHLYFPSRTWEGENRFELVTIKSRE